ncbi:MAG TPA: S16 family serine protease [Nocardioides sp.]|nr:S16 family serine protease [Nocardioides sp.]
MSQRTIAVLIAAPLLLVLGVLAVAVPLPFAAYSPGPTFDILAKDQNEAELIQVDGHKTYRDDGQIRFTTVRSTGRYDELGLGALLQRWIDPDQAVVPFEVAHPPDQTAEEDEIQGEISMVTSQDVAVAVALEELGEKVKPLIQVAHVDDGSPAFGELRVRDKFLEVDGEPVRTTDDIVEGVRDHGPGDPVELLVNRAGKRVTVQIEPEPEDGEMRIGVRLGLGYEFPFDVSIHVDESIGGPSAGLMFSLAVYDTLTPGSLTGGEVVAGTGEIGPDGKVGPIGGIEQKIAGAEDAGAELFLVPPDNCTDVSGLDPDLRLVKATTMHDARLAIEAWAEDPDAELPAC